ncbi:Zinc transporter 6 [Hibiscus syriacus]|uniref:Zinc transporter 6 n=1 Tax=Hibiscus syriacus TaxID=106335 RepID=A0A6A3B8R6_HIBSY|nr:Zinc transporter 6 [Hibiscus syriacus]
MSSCVTDTARTLACRDGAAAAHLKLLSLKSSSSPASSAYLPRLPSSLFPRQTRLRQGNSDNQVLRCRRHLSTSLVHVLPKAVSALSNCHVASSHPWKDFPFAGLVTLVGALMALLVDLTASSHVHQSHDNDNKPSGGYLPVAATQDGTGGKKTGSELSKEEAVKLKLKLVSQALEIGIIFHSVIIGVTMGMSQNQCTIRPLVLALAFHQIFEGMGLGGCIARMGTEAYMCFMFSVTTPMGIVLGMIVFAVTGYDDSSSNALIMEGLLGSMSSGILIYMALVDLIALDFFHNELMASHTWLKKASFIALALGSTSISGPDPPRSRSGPDPFSHLDLKQPQICMSKKLRPRSKSNKYGSKTGTAVVSPNPPPNVASTCSFPSRGKHRYRTNQDNHHRVNHHWVNHRIPTTVFGGAGTTLGPTGTTCINDPGSAVGLFTNNLFCTFVATITLWILGSSWL